MYHLFAGTNDCQSGGISDYVRAHKTIEEAKAEGNEYDWAQIVIIGPTGELEALITMWNGDWDELPEWVGQ